jgi:UrcA family protein
MEKLSIAAASLLMLGTGAQARAVYVNPQLPRAEHVSVADVNLQSEAGRALLYHRIRAAAEAVCSMKGDRSIEAAQAVHDCVREAVRDGKRQLTTLIAAKNGATLAAGPLAVTGR